jgi:WD40 repeat protein
MDPMGKRWPQFALAASLAALGLLLGGVGAGLLVTHSADFGNDLASIFSFALSAVTAGCAVVVWYRTSTGRRRQRQEELGRAAARARAEDHWVRSARGADATAGFFFTGREAVLARLAEIAQAGQPALGVVLGMPGAGKSAVLGVLVLRSRDAGQLTSELVRRVPPITVGCTVHARGKSVQDVTGELNTAFGVTVADQTHQQEPLFRALRGRVPAPVVIADAVDEAADPQDMAQFLTRLSWYATVLAGTRPDTAARGGTAAAPPAGMAARAVAIVDLSSQYIDRAEVSAYVCARLRADPRPGGYADGRRWTDDYLSEIIGWEVAAAAGDNFLIGQMITDELLSRPARRAVTHGWSDQLDWPTDFAGWMDRDLQRRLGTGGAWLAEALTPLAFTERDGLPFDLWVAAAQASNLDPRIGPGDVARALDLLGFYLSAAPMPGAGDGELGYRLRHERFAEYFRRGPLTARRQRAVAEVVLASVPRSADGDRDWQQISLYAQRNLLAHATRAQLLDQLAEQDPRCLAAADPAAALDAAAVLGGPMGRELRQILRHATAGATSSYSARAAQLEFHARLAGSPTLAAAFAARAGDVRDFGTPWRAGGPAAALPDGGPLATKAVLPVTWPSPAAVVIDAGFSAEVLDLSTRSPLGPRVGLCDPAGEPPDVWSAREIAGSVHLAAAQEQGRIGVWCLAGPLASPRIRATGHSIEPVRSVEVFPGPGGLVLLAALTAERPGRLKIWAVTQGRLQPTGDLPGGDCVIGLQGTAGQAGLVLASLGGGLRTVQITAATAEPSVTGGDGQAVTLLAADGDASDAVCLISCGQVIRAATLSASRIQVNPRPLGDGGPSARPALHYTRDSARAAVVDSGQLRLWNLRPRLELQAAMPTGSVVRNANFLDPAGRLIALSGFSGDITVAVADSEHGIRPLTALPATESGTSVLPVPSADPAGATVVTRAPSGVTSVWLIDGNERAMPPASALGAVTMIAAASSPAGGWVAATDGTPSVSLWHLPGSGSGQSSAIVLAHSEPVEAVAVIATAETVTTAVVGDTQASLWTLPAASGQLGDPVTWEVEPGLADHLAVASLSRAAVVAAAGPEGIRFWLAAHSEPPVPVAGISVPIESLAVLDESGDAVTVVAADEDDRLHLVTAGVGGRATVRTSPAGHEVVTRCLRLPGSAHGPRLATTSFTGEIRTWNLNGGELTLRHQLRLPEEPALVTAAQQAGRSFLAFTAPAGVIVWDTGSEPQTAALLHTSAGRPSHLVTVGPAGDQLIVCAYTAGYIAVIDPAAATVTELQLNCAFTHMTGMASPSWAVGSHGAALVAVRLRPHLTSGS